MDFEAVRKRLVGPMETVPTILDERNQLDLGATADVVVHLVDAGIGTQCGFLLVGGAVGQFTCLTTGERKALAEACVKAARGRVPVVVGCQASGTDQAIDLARHAADVGADAVQLSPPHYFFHPQLSQDDVFRFFADVADEAEVAIVGYHNWWASVGIAPRTLRRLAGEVEGFVGVKWRGRDDHETHLGYRMCADRISMIENAFHLTLTTPHQMGARGFVSYVGLVWPEHDLELWRLLEEKRYVEATSKIRALAIPLYELANSFPGDQSSVMAELLRLAGRRTWTPRRPARPLSPANREQMRQLLVGAGVPFLKRATT
jgi:dihydrodipicolinate synthase/N-acetylneuraminate lyase